MEVAGPLGTPLGLAQRKRASPRGEAGTSVQTCRHTRKDRYTTPVSVAKPRHPSSSSVPLSHPSNLITHPSTHLSINPSIIYLPLPLSLPQMMLLAGPPCARRRQSQSPRFNPKARIGQIKHPVSSMDGMQATQPPTGQRPCS